MSPAYRIAVIPGDGIGPEVIEAELLVLEATSLAFEFVMYSAGDGCREETGEALPQETLEGALAAQAVIFGAAGTSAAEVILRLKKELNTFVNLRPVRAVEGVECIHPQTDLIIIREISEGMYAGIGTTSITQAGADTSQSTQDLFQRSLDGRPC